MLHGRSLVPDAVAGPVSREYRIEWQSRIYSLLWALKVYLYIYHAHTIHKAKLYLSLLKKEGEHGMGEDLHEYH